VKVIPFLSSWNAGNFDRTRRRTPMNFANQKERKMSDTLIRQDVLDELDFDPRVNAAHIGVVVDKGVVTLTGHVGSYAEKLAVERIAQRVKGVRAIAQEIEVRYPGDKRTSDDEIATRAANMLGWTVIVPKGIQVKVQDGWITLNGQVDWHFERDAAERELRRLSGVAGIVNNITLKAHVQAKDVKRKIEDALKRNAETEAGRVSVSVLDNGKVALNGQVHDWQERNAIGWAAWSAPGVKSVENNVTIG
jgi:osmotically-inducible protein OsmY